MAYLLVAEAFPFNSCQAALPSARKALIPGGTIVSSISSAFKPPVSLSQIGQDSHGRRRRLQILWHCQVLMQLPTFRCHRAMRAEVRTCKEPILCYHMLYDAVCQDVTCSGATAATCCVPEAMQLVDELNEAGGVDQCTAGICGSLFGHIWSRLMISTYFIFQLSISCFTCFEKKCFEKNTFLLFKTRASCCPCLAKEF